MATVRLALLVACLALAASCGSDSPSSPSGGSDGTVAATLTITASGISPRTVTVPVGSRITFVNNDTRSHNMNSDPHPEHTQCPALNVGTLTAGQSRTSQNLTAPRTCGMHDHDLPDIQSLWASITIQ